LSLLPVAYELDNAEPALEDSTWRQGGVSVTYSTVARRVVVLGGGMAGLFAARVLSDHFDEVILIDRDDVPETPHTRNGVPQGKHFHALLPGGLKIASELFPGFTHDLVSAGAVSCVAGQDFHVYRPEGRSYALATYQPEPQPMETIYFMSRPLLEHCLRQRVHGLPNVTTRYGSLVRDPLSGDERVTGVVIEGGERVTADLVIDASGRNARTVQWLTALGYEAPAESVVNCDFAYASAVVRPSDPDALDGAGFFVLPKPDGPHTTRGAYVVRIEGDNWIAGLGSRFGDYPPTDVDDWRAFGRTLVSPAWDQALSTAELVTRPVGFKFPRSVRRHFERLDRFPDGLLPLGDSVCHFNPLYGQGMSAAACQAQALGHVLERRARASQGLAGLAFDFLPEAFEVTRTPWALAAAADFLDNRTTGDFPTEEMQSLAMLQLVSTLAESDADAAQLTVDIFTLVRPLSALHEPPWPERLSAGGVGAVSS
jgi:2-polyprenyl-6-methoxyphenol hydroxylase-like FAD-dependent oxidoreductase